MQALSYFIQFYELWYTRCTIQVRTCLRSSLIFKSQYLQILYFREQTLSNCINCGYPRERYSVDIAVCWVKHIDAPLSIVWINPYIMLILNKTHLWSFRKHIMHFIAFNSSRIISCIQVAKFEYYNLLSIFSQLYCVKMLKLLKYTIYLLQRQTLEDIYRSDV